MNECVILNHIASYILLTLYKYKTDNVFRN